MVSINSIIGYNTQKQSFSANGTNRKECAAAITTLTKSLSHVEGEGDVLTISRLNRANLVLGLAEELQKIAKDLYKNSVEGIIGVLDKPDADKTDLQKSIEIFGTVVEDRLKKLELAKKTKDKALLISMLKQRLAATEEENNMLNQIVFDYSYEPSEKEILMPN